MNLRHQLAVLIGATTLAGGAAASVAADAAPNGAPACQGASLRSSPSDIDGDGTSDLAVGVRKATESGHYNVGAVDVHFDPQDGSRTQQFTESMFGATPVRGDSFGSSLTFLAANDDQCADLAVGAPRVDGDRGTVTIALGSDSGISATGAISLTGRTPGEGFGSKMVADGHDLFVSAPDRTVDGMVGAGAIDHYRVDGGTATLVQTLTENTPGIHGGAETGDGFGRDLSVAVHGGPLVVGEPAEDVGSHAVDAGTVTTVYYSASTGLLTRSATYSQDSPGIPGTAESGDHFGTSVAIGPGLPWKIIVGVPGEALGSLRGAGTVDTFFISDKNPAIFDVTALSQNSQGVPGADESYDRFGKQVANVGGGMCIGVPGEDIGVFGNTGDVLCQNIGESDDGRWFALRMGDEPIGGSPQRGAAYGTYLATLPDTQDAAGPHSDASAGGEAVLIGVPRARVAHDVNSGQVRIASDVSVHDSTGPVPNEQYGVPAFVPSVGPGENFD